MHSKTNITFSILAIAAAVLLFATGPIVGNAFASSEQSYHHYYHPHHHYYHHNHHHYYHHNHHYYYHKNYNN
ncbi:MAG: hypothetical protein M3Y53_08410 [Thermoproteota archaeon]|nr:hypothetical protein [Thermoproteota archaeon]